MVILFVFIFSLFIAYYVGDKRKIGIGWAFFFSLVFSPVVGLFIALSSRRKSKYLFTKKYPKYKIGTLNLILGILCIILGLFCTIGSILLINTNQGNDSGNYLVITFGIGFLGCGIYFLLDEPVIATKISEIKNQKTTTDINLEENFLDVKIDNVSQDDYSNLNLPIISAKLQQNNFNATKLAKVTRQLKVKGFTFNNSLKYLFIILSIVCIALLLPNYSNYSIDIDEYGHPFNDYSYRIVMVRYCLASIIFSVLAFRKYKIGFTSEMLVYLALVILYQPIIKIKLDVFSPYVDIFISLALFVDIIDFKGKSRLINWLAIKED